MTDESHTGMCLLTFCIAQRYKDERNFAAVFQVKKQNTQKNSIICPFAKGGSQLPRPGIGLALMNPGHEIGFGAGWGMY